jgi:hypothetical protein
MIDVIELVGTVFSGLSALVIEDVEDAGEVIWCPHLAHHHRHQHLGGSAASGRDHQPGYSLQVPGRLALTSGPDWSAGFP